MSDQVPTAPERLKLFHQYLPLAYKLASLHQPTAMLGYDDYLSIAMLALWDAAGRFVFSEDRRGFATYATRTISADIIDELRRMHGRPGSRRQMTGRRSISLDGWLAHEKFEHDGVGSNDHDLPDPTVDVSVEAERTWTQSAVQEAVSNLPEREARVIWANDLEGRSLQSIADDMGRSRARVSQIRSRALGRLRVTLAGLA